MKSPQKRSVSKKPKSSKKMPSDMIYKPIYDNFISHLTQLNFP